MTKQLNTTPIQGADGQPINIGDPIVVTNASWGCLNFGTYKGFTYTESAKSYNNPMQVRMTVTIRYKDNNGFGAHIREKIWGPKGTVPVVKTNKMARR